MPHNDGPERWAAAVVQRELGLAVEVHDDNSRPSMYDLRIGAEDHPDYAIEVIRAIDAAYTKTQRAAAARNPLHLNVQGDWTIWIRSDAVVSRVAEELTPVLLEMETCGVFTADGDDDPGDDEQSAIGHDLHDLGISHIRCHRLDGSGKVYLFMPIAAAFLGHPNALPRWVEGFLRSSSVADVRAKLAASGGARREAFVPAHLAGPPPSVFMYLTDDLVDLPTAAPDLPNELTGVWVCAPGNAFGLYWGGSRWRRVVSDLREPSRPTAPGPY